MKKVLALFLSIVLIMGAVLIPAGAADTEKHEKCPIIFIAGSSVDICDKDGNVISTGFDVIMDDDEMAQQELIETIVAPLIPFFAEGITDDEWENYGRILYEKFAPIWDETQIGPDGNPKYGTGVAKAEIESWDKKAATVNTGADGRFNLSDYKFRYDWRLSPYDEVDRLHEYIKTIIKTTGCPQVSLVGRCLGGNIVTAYLEKYGHEKLVKKAVFDEVMSNGSVVISEIFSGQISFSDKHLHAYLLESECFGKHGVGIDLEDVNDLLLKAAERLIDLLTQTGASQEILDTVGSLYERLYEAFMPAMLMATGIGTWPSYWVSVFERDLDAALDLLIGAEGSESREKYAGFLEKIEYIREHITIPRTLEGEDNLYKKFQNEYGVEIAVIAGYGLVNAPLIESQDETGDCTVDTKSSSFGATAAGVFDTLSEEYINSRIADGFERYISPDGKIDASTCLFPKTTWLIKNKHHDTFRSIEILSEYFTQYSNVTADSNERNISRFLVCENVASENFVNMTKDNCQDGSWLTDVQQEPTTETMLASLIRFFTVFFEFITKLIQGEISFDF